MKRVMLGCSLLLLGLMVARGVAQEPPAPSDEHKVLKMDVGKWNAELKYWPAGPDSDPITSNGVETNRMLGDFWTVSEFKGEFGGAPFEGHGTFGYDTKKGKYVGSWIDSMSPFPSHMEGTYDAKTKTMTMKSEGIDPATGEKAIGKNVSVYVDAYTRKFTMYMLAPGTEDTFVKAMEITYTRAK